MEKIQAPAIIARIEDGSVVVTIDTGETAIHAQLKPIEAIRFASGLRRIAIETLMGKPSEPSADGVQEGGAFPCLN